MTGSAAFCMIRLRSSEANRASRMRRYSQWSITAFSLVLLTPGDHDLAILFMAVLVAHCLTTHPSSGSISAM